MELQPLTIEGIFEQLRGHFAEDQTTVFVDARIAITANEARLLEMHAAQPLQTIRY